jgi:hypothetical protein
MSSIRGTVGVYLGLSGVCLFWSYHGLTGNNRITSRLPTNRPELRSLLPTTPFLAPDLQVKEFGLTLPNETGI